MPSQPETSALVLATFVVVLCRDAIRWNFYYWARIVVFRSLKTTRDFTFATYPIKRLTDTSVSDIMPQSRCVNSKGGEIHTILVILHQYWRQCVVPGYFEISQWGAKVRHHSLWANTHYVCSFLGSWKKSRTARHFLVETSVSNTKILHLQGNCLNGKPERQERILYEESSSFK